MITYAQLGAILPDCRTPAVWAEEFTRTLPGYGIVTREQLAHFIGQVAVESQQLNRLTENLNYSAQGLANTWARFSTTGKRGGPPTQQALDIQRQPERIANIVYANRLGNGPPESGDGWKFRGHSLIQTTGRLNINEALAALGLPLDDPSPLATPQWACKAAALYWQSRDCNALVGDIVALTGRVNGGSHGLLERKAFTEKALAVL